MRPSYPSEHAAAAAAAASVLSYVIANDDPTGFEAMAREAGESRILAGAAFRGDVEAGWAIGQEVAARVIARAQQDGSNDAWNGSVPDGGQYWKPTPPRHVFPPFDPLAGTWRTWVLPSGNALRPPPHPPFGSPAFEADVDELRALNTSRTAEQADIARFWATDPPPSRWIDFMLDEIRVRRLSTLRSARALALASVAMHDALVACWDAKYHYWLVRPITVDPTIITVFSTPPFPSYPSGHSTISSAAAEVFASLFPDAATRYHANAEQASFSRVWGAVHYRFDIVAGEELGREVGRMVVERGQAMIDNR
jgi:membrane-associated phospholipid phosphatase